MEEWARAEHDFALMAFDIAYKRLFANEEDRTLRFLKSLAYSARPIPEGKREAMLDWHKEFPASELKRKAYRHGEPAWRGDAYLKGREAWAAGKDETPPPCVAKQDDGADLYLMGFIDARAEGVEQRHGG